MILYITSLQYDSLDRVHTSTSSLSVYCCRSLPLLTRMNVQGLEVNYSLENEYEKKKKILKEECKMSKPLVKFMMWEDK